MVPVISVNKICKKYRLGSKEPYYSLRDTLSANIKNPLNLFTGFRKTEEFWALKDISFSVNKGEVVGIIGKNGAGKTTLLKILSRITPPTSGSAVIQGRVASLLEVGTGFHPELTGRENIYLNGAILGMNRREIKIKFSSIVHFAEVERFLDTPVKRYSSGMQMRLAFAVAAHLEADILLIDEVLSVGDALFQKKSLGKMESIAKGGRTILFVSHNMGMVRQICSKGILLNDGKASSMLPINDLIDIYQRVKTISANRVDIKGFNINFSEFCLNRIELNHDPILFPNEKVEITARYENKSKKTYDLCLSFAFRKKEDYTLSFYSHNHLENIRYKIQSNGSVKMVMILPHLSPGKYSLEMQAWLDGNLVIDSFELGEFSIMSVPAFASHQSPSRFPAHLLIPTKWEFS